MQKVIGIVGGGIVGLALGYKLQKKFPTAKLIVFEKENELGKHQSGRNSGVLHCGLYYEPGSLKAKLAVSGIKQMTEFCQVYQINHETCGKVVVATNDKELLSLENLAKKGADNGLAGLKFLISAELSAREPFVKSIKSLLVPEEGIVDYKAVMKKLAFFIRKANGEILLNTELSGANYLTSKIIVNSNNHQWELDYLINCTGLHTDRIFKKFTHNKVSPIKIVPFRGEYYKLLPEAEKLVYHLIYPVPDADYPFLGVHFTRMISGEKEVGSNAVFALKREGYTNTDISIRDTFESLSYKGFFNFIRLNFQFAIGEFGSSIFKSMFVKKAQKMIPDLDASHFVRGMAGVRAQAMDINGKLIMDFRIIREGNQVHLLNAPSSGATASLAIADHIIESYLNKI